MYHGYATLLCKTYVANIFPGWCCHSNDNLLEVLCVQSDTSVFQMENVQGIAFRLLGNVMEMNSPSMQMLLLEGTKLPQAYIFEINDNLKYINQLFLMYSMIFSCGLDGK